MSSLIDDVFQFRLAEVMDAIGAVEGSPADNLPVDLEAIFTEMDKQLSLDLSGSAAIDIPGSSCLNSPDSNDCFRFRSVSLDEQNLRNTESQSPFPSAKPWPISTSPLSPVSGSSSPGFTQPEFLPLAAVCPTDVQSLPPCRSPNPIRVPLSTQNGSPRMSSFSLISPRKVSSHNSLSSSSTRGSSSEDESLDFRQSPFSSLDSPIGPRDGQFMYRRQQATGKTKKRMKQEERCPLVWEFLASLLADKGRYGDIISLTDEENGVIKVHQNQRLAQMWSEQKGRKQRSITWENMSRGLRYYYPERNDRARVRVRSRSGGSIGGGGLKRCHGIKIQHDPKRKLVYHLPGELLDKIRKLKASRSA